ncbi:MAG TPA: hypothetical protein VFO85_21910, partial [Vicinamibacteria bacterium]|nr:hypothetical protein [Vicinamibacteria bacterium]
VPLRGTRGLEALALLFDGADQPRPRPRVVTHLGHMAAAVTPALELWRTLPGAWTEERIAPVARRAAAAVA